MKAETLFTAIGSIEPDLVAQADNAPEEISARTKTGCRRPGALKYAAAAACILLVAAAVSVPIIGSVTGVRETGAPSAASGVSDSPDGEAGGNGAETGEAVYYQNYNYSVDSGKYSSYQKGKVIAVAGSRLEQEKIGSKISDVTVTAGWVKYDGAILSEEHARAEIYEIKGVSDDVAVALLFKDKLEAQTLEHYYVMINPDADPEPVKAYLIQPYDEAGLDGGTQNEDQAEETTRMS